MTALRLAVERGLENVTVEDITAEAGVSLRTFGNYFSSKYEAICAIGTDHAGRIGATLLASGRRAAVRRDCWRHADALRGRRPGARRRVDGQARLKLVLATPAIRGEYLKINSEMQEALAEAIATREFRDIWMAGPSLRRKA